MRTDCGSISAAPHNSADAVQMTMKVILVNHGADRFEVTSGLRIAQLVIAPVARAEVLEVDDLPVGGRPRELLRSPLPGEETHSAPCHHAL
jgi:hypothetical protein